MRIYLADLGHNQVTMSSDVYPLGVADLASYAKAYFDGPETLDISIFREPQDLKKALDAGPPEVLGLSSYAWNHELSLSFARYAKAKRPEILTLMGGPNYPLTTEEEESYLRSEPMSVIDVAVRGPTYEGERAFLNVIRRFSEVGSSVEGLQEEPLAGNAWINRATGEFIKGDEVPRMDDLDEIPSPYLSGLMDPFFATGYFPLLQIARGCPFRCAFCNSAVLSNNKIHRHSVENVQADLLYIAQRVKPEAALCFADDNFGMYAMDEEIADYIAYLQKRYEWPQYIRTTTGKNNHERIIRVMDKVGGALPMTSAVQSMNSEVLVNIERSNIKLDTYAKIQDKLRQDGMQSYGELIICLPGETKASLMKGIEDLLDSGVKRVSAHQLMLLHGAPLSNPQSREQWGFKTKFRVVARNIGKYIDQPVVEVDEIVIETPTIRFEEYLDLRVFHLLLTIFYYEGNFEEAFALAKQEGVKPYDVIVKLFSMLDEAPAAFQDVIDDYRRENQDLLFDTKEECQQWAAENFQGLVEGRIGGNLIQKYSMLGRFFVTGEAIEFLRAAIDATLPHAGDQVTEQLDAVISYLRCVMLHVPFAETLNASPDWTTRYDVEAWVQANYSKPLGSFPFPSERTFATTVDPKRKKTIESRLDTFGEHPNGLGKFTRTMFARHFRRSLVGAGAQSTLPVGA